MERIKSIIAFLKKRWTENTALEEPNNWVDQAIADWVALTKRCERLIEADDPQVPALELELDISRRAAVTHFIEHVDWGVDTFPEYQGGRGLPSERLAALRAKWEDYKKPEGPG